MQSSPKRHRTINVLRSETLISEARIQKMIGQPSWIRLPNPVPATGRKSWRKRNWEKYHTTLESTLEAICRHQALPRFFSRLPLSLKDHLLRFLTPLQTTSVVVPHELAQDCLNLRLVCKQWKTTVDNSINRSDLMHKTNLEVGMLCLHKCATNCALSITKVDEWQFKHSDMLLWKQHMETIAFSDQFEEELNALRLRIPSIIGRVELEYLEHTRFPSPASVWKEHIEMRLSPQKKSISGLANVVTCPVIQEARERLLWHQMELYNVSADAGKYWIAMYLEGAVFMPVMLFVWKTRSESMLKRMRATTLNDACLGQLCESIRFHYPQTTAGWEQVWQDHEEYLLQRVQCLRRAKLERQLESF